MYCTYSKKLVLDPRILYMYITNVVGGVSTGAGLFPNSSLHATITFMFLNF